MFDSTPCPHCRGFCQPGTLCSSTRQLVKAHFFTRAQWVAAVAFIGVLVFTGQLLYAVGAATAAYFLAKTEIVKAMLTALGVCVGIWILLSSTGLLQGIWRG